MPLFVASTVLEGIIAAQDKMTAVSTPAPQITKQKLHHNPNFSKFVKSKNLSEILCFFSNVSSSFQELNANLFTEKALQNNKIPPEVQNPIFSKVVAKKKKTVFIKFKIG